MLIIMRRADETGALGSVFTVGDMQVTVMRVNTFSAKLRVQHPGGGMSVSTVPFNCKLRPADGVLIMPFRVNHSQFSTRKVRIGIEAPDDMDIARDDIKQGRAA